MQIPNLTLAYAVSEAKPFFESAFVRKVQELENGWLKIKLHTKQGQKDLVVAKEIFFISEYSMPAKQSASGFSAFARSRLENKKILSLQQHGFDRVIEIEFSGYSLIFELFAKGNIVLADREKKILAVQHREQWKDRELKKNALYKFPSSKGKNPAEIALKEFSSLQKNSLEIIKSLVKTLNIAPVFAEEALFQSEIKKETPAENLSQKELESLFEKITLLYCVENRRLKPVLAEKGSEQFILPFPIKTAKTIREFSSLQGAFQEFFAKGFLQTEQRETELAAGKKILALEKNLETQLKAKQMLENKIIEERKKGEAVFANYSELSRAVDVFNMARAKGEGEKTIMYKLSVFGFVRRIDLKKRRLVVELA